MTCRDRGHADTSARTAASPEIVESGTLGSNLLSGGLSKQNPAHPSMQD